MELGASLALSILWAASHISIEVNSLHFMISYKNSFDLARKVMCNFYQLAIVLACTLDEGE